MRKDGFLLTTRRWPDRSVWWTDELPHHEWGGGETKKRESGEEEKGRSTGIP